MDILTTRGQKTAADELDVAKWVESFGYSYIHSPKDKPATVDAIVTKGKNIYCIAETKCRYRCDSSTFMNTWGGEWLVTWEKVQTGILLAKSLCVPFIGFLYLPDSGEITGVEISDSNGVLSTAVRLEATETQATCNGGYAARTNAFIKINTTFHKVKAKQ